MGKSTLTCLDEDHIVLNRDHKYQYVRGTRPGPYQFDAVYPEETTQDEFCDGVKPLISKAVEGYNVCILAFGQTGSGKTYSMFGTNAFPGIIPRAMQQFFDEIRDKPQYEVSLACVEIYNNQINDLLISPEQRKKKINLIQNQQGHVEIHGAIMPEVQDEYEVQH